ncbi:hypothetical protein [Marinospirillum sp.]|uniref:hypothetical protein n=1 Tax=Marinospirillum sp. TaxID=2183934 RepID=UPI00385047F0
MVKLVDLDHKWAVAIGRIFVAFGSIESCTYKCIDAFAEETIAKFLKSMPLAKRTEVLIDLVSPKNLETENKTEFLNNLEEIRKLLEKRNLIAHNPLVLQVYDEETSDTVWRERIISEKNKNKSIDYDEIMVIADKSESLSSSIHSNMAKFRLEGVST